MYSLALARKSCQLKSLYIDGIKFSTGWFSGRIGGGQVDRWTGVSAWADNFLGQLGHRN